MSPRITVPRAPGEYWVRARLGAPPQGAARALRWSPAADRHARTTNSARTSRILQFIVLTRRRRAERRPYSSVSQDATGPHFMSQSRRKVR